MEVSAVSHGTGHTGGERSADNAYETIHDPAAHAPKVSSNRHGGDSICRLRRHQTALSQSSRGPPAITHGLQSGDVSNDSAVVWARADRPARMLVEWSTTESFKHVQDAGFVDALPETDCTAKMLLENLPAGEQIFYRIRFADFAWPTIMSEAMVGRFRTAPADQRSLTFIWSGDTAGQGWGIDESRGGMRTYATMLRNRPDFFVHSGDNIYADGPIAAEQMMPNGETWKNIVTEENAKPA